MFWAHVNTLEMAPISQDFSYLTKLLSVANFEEEDIWQARRKTERHLDTPCLPKETGRKFPWEGMYVRVPHRDYKTRILEILDVRPVQAGDPTNISGLRLQVHDSTSASSLPVAWFDYHDVKEYEYVFHTLVSGYYLTYF